MNVNLLETPQDFTNFVRQQTDKLVVVDFYADWCGPCKRIAPKYIELADQYTNVVFCKVNVDENPKISQEFQITGLPTFLLFKKGQIVDKVVGVNLERLEQLVEDLN